MEQILKQQMKSDTIARLKFTYCFIFVTVDDCARAEANNQKKRDELFGQTD